MSLIRIDENRVNEIILENGRYVPTGFFNSYITQLPTGDLSDVVETVTFGAGGTTADGTVTLDANGIFTQLKPLSWFMKLRTRLTRTGAGSYAEVFFQLFRRDNDQSPWLPLGTSVDIELDTDRQVETIIDASFYGYAVGTQVKLTWARSSLGANAGELTPGTPSAALITAGISQAPSAQATIFSMAGGL